MNETCLPSICCFIAGSPRSYMSFTLAGDSTEVVNTSHASPRLVCLFSLVSRIFDLLVETKLGVGQVMSCKPFGSTKVSLEERYSPRSECAAIDLGLVTE